MRASFLPFVALAAISTPALAQRQQAVGPGAIPLNATGILNGVDMSASGTTGTLTVGVVGGPATDIYTSNSPFVAGRVAVATAASSQGNIAFNSGSTVFGDIGVTQPGGPFLLAITGGNNGTVVNFMGNVYATTTNVLGTGRLNFNSGSTNISATNFGGDGTISLAPNSRLIGALAENVMLLKLSASRVSEMVSTANLSGTAYPPSLGNSAVVNSVSWMRTVTGTWPQYSSPLAANLMSSLSSSGTRTK